MIGLDDRLVALQARLVEAFGDAVTPSAFLDELTIVTTGERLLDVLAGCRDDPEIRCELLADLSGVHWPAGVHVESGQETTGWPIYQRVGAGQIEVDYILYSVAHNHRLRVRVSVDDTDPQLPSATSLYGSANFMEREVWDFFGVRFDGHPNLVRVLMPDDWEGHPHRKDYPLGGVEVVYKGQTIPPPDERHY